MGFLSSLFDTFDNFFLGPDEPEAQPAPEPEPVTTPKPPPEPVKKPDAPDFGLYWKQYKGWIQNINDRTTGELADMRARLSAAGSSPDLMMMQTEHLESQRKSEISKLEGGQTKRFLDEAFQIASGVKENPYAQALPGTGVEPKPSGVTDYFTKYYDGTLDAAPVDAGAEAKKRAKMAAGGGAEAPSGGPGASSRVFGGLNDDSFWR